jgi:hypothetical protein
MWTHSVTKEVHCTPLVPYCKEMRKLYPGEHMECKVCKENYVRGMGRCFPQIKGCTSVDAWGNCMQCGCTYDPWHRFIEDSMKEYYAKLGVAQMKSKGIEIKDLPKEIQQILQTVLVGKKLAIVFLFLVKC